MNNNTFIKKIFITIAGTILVIVGLVGWLLPILPGLFLVFIGLPMMLVLTPWAEKIKIFMDRIFKKQSNTSQ